MFASLTGLRSFLSFVAIFVAALVLNTTNAFATPNCPAGYTLFETSNPPGTSNETYTCFPTNPGANNGAEGGDGGNGGEGGSGGAGGVGGLGGVGVGGSVQIGNFGGQGYEINEEDPNAPAPEYGPVLSPSQDQGQEQGQGQSQDQDIYFDNDTHVEAPSVPVNSAPASIGGSCNSGLALSFKDVSGSVGSGNPVCDLLAVARGFAATGDLAKAAVALDEAHDAAKFRAQLSKIRGYLTLGLL